MRKNLWISIAAILSAIFLFFVRDDFYASVNVFEDTNAEVQISHSISSSASGGTHLDLYFNLQLDDTGTGSVIGLFLDLLFPESLIPQNVNFEITPAERFSIT